MASGLLSAAQVMNAQTILDRSLELRNQSDRDWKAVFCRPTDMEYVRVKQNGMVMKEMGSETSTPPAQKGAYQTITLPAPKRYGLAAGVSREAIDQGITQTDLEDLYVDMAAADNELVTNVVLRAMLLSASGGWWDGTATPPDYASNTFLSTHSHYVARSASGIPARTDFVTAVRHIKEHGVDVSNCAFLIAGETASEIEDLPEWEDNYSTPQWSALNEMGLTPQFRAAGRPVIPSEWVPSGYALLVDMSSKPCLWRHPIGVSPTEGLRIYNPLGNVTDIRYAALRQCDRWASCKVVKRSAGVAMYFGGSSYTDPTITVGS